MEWPTFAFGVLFFLAGFWQQLIGVLSYQGTRAGARWWKLDKLPRWLQILGGIPFWNPRYDRVFARISGALLSVFGIVLIVVAAV